MVLMTDSGWRDTVAFVWIVMSIVAHCSWSYSLVPYSLMRGRSDTGTLAVK